MMHDGTTDFLKMLTILGFICVAVWWLNDAIGTNYTVLVIFALVGVLLFAGGALYGHVNQKMTLDAITKFNANDAKIDRYRLETMKESQKGQTAWDKAQAAITILDAKRIDKLADQRAKALIIDQQAAQSDDTWTWDDDNADDDDDGFQVWQ